MGLLLMLVCFLGGLACGPARPMGKGGNEQGVLLGVRNGPHIQVIPEEERGHSFARKKRPDPKVEVGRSSHESTDCVVENSTEVAFCDPLLFPGVPVLDAYREFESDGFSDSYFVWEEQYLDSKITQIQAQHLLLGKNNKWKEMKNSIRVQFDTDSRRWFIPLSDLVLNLEIKKEADIQKLNFWQELRLSLRLRDERQIKVSIRYKMKG